MSNFQSALVQFAYYGAYFSLAIPAALINRRFGYKVGVLTGLGLAVGRRAAVHPGERAARLRVLPRSPCSCWRPGCRSSRPRPIPFVIAMGPEEQRDPAAQPGPVVQPGRREHRRAARRRADPAPDHLGGGEDDHEPRRSCEQSQEADLSLVLGPYLGIAAVLAPDLAADRSSARWRRRRSRARRRRGSRAGRSAASGATGTTATAWPRSSSTSPRRSARGRSRSSTPRTWSASPRRTRAGTCRPA